MNRLHGPWIGLVVLVRLAVPSATVADDSPDADRVAVEALVKETVARLDEAEDARYAYANSENALKYAKVALDQAEMTRVKSEIAVVEFVEGRYPEDVKTANLEIKLAEEDLARVTDWLARMEKDREG